MAQQHTAQTQESSPAKTSLSFLLNNENDADTPSGSLLPQRISASNGTRIQSPRPADNYIDLTDTPVSPSRSHEVVEILDDDSEDDDVIVTRVVERSTSASGSTSTGAGVTAEVRANERRRRRREFAGFLNAILTAAHHHHHHHFHPYPRQASPPISALPSLFMPLVQPPNPPRRKTRTATKAKAPRPTRPGFTRTILPEDAPDAVRRDPECPVCDKGLRGGEMWAVKGCGHVVCGTCVGGLKEKKKCGVCERRVKGAGDVLQLFV